MRILFVADLHYVESWYRWLRTRAPYHDLLVIGGDLLDQNHPSSQEKQIRQVTGWIHRFPQPVLICSGNHDRVYDSTTSTWQSPEWLTGLSLPRVRTRSGITRFRGVSFLIRNFREPSTSGRADIWVSHMPPSGNPVARSTIGPEDGDTRLAKRLKKNGPRLLLCGHQHTPEHWRAHVGRTLCLNPGMNPGGALPNHIMLDTDASTACWTTANATSVYVEKIPIPTLGERSSSGSAAGGTLTETLHSA